MADPARAVVLGAGFAGLHAALALEAACRRGLAAEVTLVDQHNYHLFLPLLYQVATGTLEPGHITFPVRAIARTRCLKFQESRVLNIDLNEKRLITDDGHLDYDYLVLAPGSITNYFNRKDVEQWTLPLKGLKDGITIHNRLIDAYEGAMMANDAPKRREWLTFVVVGGGATGVELIGSIQDYIHHVLSRDYPAIKPHEVRVVLAEAQGQLLPGLSPTLAKVARQRLSARGIEVRLNTLISQVEPNRVITDKGEAIPCRTVIWVAGVKAPPLIESLPLPKAKDGRLIVGKYLEIPEYPEVYAIGDCAFFASEDEPPLPPKGQVAVQEGRAAGRDIIRRLKGEPRRPFKFQPQADLVSLGRNAAVAQLWAWGFDGFPAWLLWRLVYLTKLAGFRNKLSVALDWSLAYFHRHNTARLE